VVPIPYDLARSLVPAQYGILKGAYESLLPGFPEGFYPVCFLSFFLSFFLAFLPRLFLGFMLDVSGLRRRGTSIEKEVVKITEER